MNSGIFAGFKCLTLGALPEAEDEDSLESSAETKSGIDSIVSSSEMHCSTFGSCWNASKSRIEYMGSTGGLGRSTMPWTTCQFNGHPCQLASRYQDQRLVLLKAVHIPYQEHWRRHWCQWKQYHRHPYRQLVVDGPKWSNSKLEECEHATRKVKTTKKML